MKLKQLILSACIAMMVIAVPAQASELTDAIYNGNNNKVRELLDSGADPNESQTTGDYVGTPISIAVEKGNIEAVKMLIRKGVTIGTLGSVVTESPLVTAIKNGNMEIAKLLVDAKSDEYGTPLHYAVQAGNIEIIQLCLSKKMDINAQIKYVGTPLCQAPNAEVAKFLIEKGANINKGNPLASAAWANKLDVVKLLVSKGADMNAKDEDGYTSLHEAVARNMINDPLRSINIENTMEIVKFLIEKGAKINIKDNEGKTALAIAIQNASEAGADNKQEMDKMVDYLKSKGAK